jgi:small multidrug resistance pump
MDSRTVAMFVTIGFSIVGVLGDYFLKLASDREQSLRSAWFKLATIGVVYSVSMTLLLTAIGVLLFREKLNAYEVLGLLMAVTSLVLLMRFS